MSETQTTERPALETRGLRVGYGDREVLHDLDVALPAGRVTTIIGPNGCGKSTLLKTLGRILRPSAGIALLDGTNVHERRPRELARHLAMLPQNPVAPEGLTVADLASRGRQPHQPWYRQWSEEDDAITAEALRATGVETLADRPLEELSGGQRQRAWIAMTLAQQTPTLLLDEPTTHLDVAHAVEVLDLVVALRRDTARTIVMVLHDIGLAARYSDHLVVMQAGRIVRTGDPREVVTSELMSTVFGLEAHVFADPVDGLPTVVPVTHA